MTKLRQILFMRMYPSLSALIFLNGGRGCEPLTPNDIAEIIVFTAGRKENVVVADTLVLANHQVSLDQVFSFELIYLCFDI